MKTKYQHIHFIKTKCKHMPYTIHGNRHFLIMGVIEYHKLWKKYVVSYEFGYVFDEDCSRDIADFLDQMNKK